MAHGILMHNIKDDVGVAVVDVEAGVAVLAVTLDGQPVGQLNVTEDIRLGHKVAMRDIAEGQAVIEYGRPIGKATQAIVRGAHVHVHNLKSLRWNL